MERFKSAEVDDDEENNPKDCRNYRLSKEDKIGKIRKSSEILATAILQQAPPIVRNDFQESCIGPDVQSNDVGHSTSVSEEIQLQALRSTNLTNRRFCNILNLDTNEIMNVESEFTGDHEVEFRENYDLPNVSMSIAMNTVNKVSSSSTNGENGALESLAHSTQYSLFSATNDIKQVSIPIESQLHDVSLSVTNTHTYERKYNEMLMRKEFGHDNSTPTRQDFSITLPTVVNTHSRILPDTVVHSEILSMLYIDDFSNKSGNSMNVNLFRSRSNLHQQQNVTQIVDTTEVIKNDQAFLDTSLNFDNLPKEEQEISNETGIPIEKEISKFKKIRKTPEQLDYLCSQYLIDKHPDIKMIHEIARKTGLEKKAIQSWFRHERWKDKRTLVYLKRV